MATDLAGIRTARPLRLDEGAAAARARSGLIDSALEELAFDSLGPDPEVAVLAVGGYGRGELSPHSDIDLLFLLPARSRVTAATLRGLLYPLWDAGWQVGHAVRGPKEAIEISGSDLDAATASLSARLVAGDPELFGELIQRRTRWLGKHGRSIARRIVEGVTERHRRVARAGWALAPDLKDDRGGLRDVHALTWAGVVAGTIEIPGMISSAASVLLAAREGLHAEAGRKQDQLRMHLQPAVARRLGLEGEGAPDELMTAVHGAARDIEHESRRCLAETLASVLGGPRRTGTTMSLGGGVRLADGAVTIDRGVEPSPVGGLRVLAGVAASGRQPETYTARWLDDCFQGEAPTRWPAEAADIFLQLLAGAHSSTALEALDHAGGWRYLMPEWLTVRGRPQYDPYHRYTVDGHSFIAVEEIGKIVAEVRSAADALSEAGDTGILYLATLLHDAGKGSGEDHSVAGERIAHSITKRMGISIESADEVATLVRHHLALVDTATRRDLSDGAVIEMVASTVKTARILRSLYVLTIADARATGPEGWSDWKAALVLELYRKTLIAIETGELPARSDVRARALEVEAFEPALAGRAEAVLETLPPSYLDGSTVPDIADDVKLLLSPPGPGKVSCRFETGNEPGQWVVTVCAVDRPGTLARTAGVLALNRISVLSAQAYATTTGLALERFIVSASDAPDIDQVQEDLIGAYSGRLAIDARLRRKALDYKPAGTVEPDVRILDDASDHSTLIEVRAPDALGLLYAITSAMADLDLDIHVAKIDTLGQRVVDAFYVRNAWAEKLDEAQASEVARSIEHRIARLFED